jgi:hypothetical protein
MAMKRNFCLAFVMLYLLAGCEEEIDRPIDASETGLLVVDGMLTNERKNHLVKLRITHSDQNEIAQAASGAVVRIQGGNEIYDLTEYPAASGNYYTPEFRAVTNQKYALVIQYGDKQFTAVDEAVPVEPLEALRYKKANSGYSFVFNPSGQDANYVDHYLTWKHTDQCETGEDCESNVVFYDLKTIDVNEIFKPDEELFTFPLHTIVVRRKFSVSAAYKDFLRSLLSETRWRGGLFDVQRADLSTNLKGGAVGFFAVSTVVSDTTVIRQP